MGILADIREGLAANLAAIPDLQIPERGYMLSNATPPTSEIFPGGPAGRIEYDRAMGRGLDKIPFTVRVLVALASEIGAQAAMDDYLEPTGARSVRAALSADRTLGGAANSLHVVSCSGPQQFLPEGKPPLLGAEWFVDVYANGS